VWPLFIPGSGILLSMDKTAQKILDEIAEERKELQVSAVLTALTLVGLVGGVVTGFMSLPVFVPLGLFALAYLAGGYPPAKEAIAELFEGKLNIDLLMVLAALAAAGVGEVRDGAILLFLFSLAGTLEGYAMGNTKRSIAALMELRPDEARKVLEDGSTSMVPVESLMVDDVVLVRPGERIATDGEVVSGRGAVDESSVTGESVPVDKEPGAPLFAGTLNQNAVLHVRVTVPANQSTLARMITLVTEAQETKAPSERFSDWFGERYTYVVLFGSIAALGIFLVLGMPFAVAAYKAATLLVVASPCAIVISVPAAVLSALAAAARKGVLFKGGAALEQFGRVHTFAFDKTGTITHGELEVVDVVSFGMSEPELINIALTVERHSDHPLAQSVVRYAEMKGATVVPDEDSTMIAGKGVLTVTKEGQTLWAGNRALLAVREVSLSADMVEKIEELEATGKTPVIVGREKEILGVFGLADTLRDSAKPLMDDLRRHGVKEFHMLTGDTQRVAEAIGSQAGLVGESIHGALLPEDKVVHVRNLQAAHPVAFIGDGVNDAAALATAEVGVAMGVAGSDVALEAADVALLSDNLENLGYAYRLSHQANNIIKQNLIFAVGIMLLMVVITIFWYLPLPLGVLGHEGGTLLVVSNSLRLLFMKIS